MTLLPAGRVLRNPALTAVALLTLALSIGATTAIFSVVESVLLKPLAYPEPDRIVTVTGGATPVRFAEMRTAARTFTALGAFTSEEDITIAGAGQPEVVKGARVSAGFLRILGVNPLAGRDFLPAEDLPGGPAVAIIGADLWQRRFNGDPKIVGSSITLSGAPYVVVGVLPAHFAFPSPGLSAWLARPSEWPVIPPKSRPLSPFLSVFGRLKPGVSLREASAETAVIQAQYAANHPAMLDAKLKAPEHVAPLKETLVAGMRSALWMLTGAVGFVLLIACANIANLLLAQGSARGREFAIRSALGATRGRLTRRLLRESVLLSLAGGTLGLVLAFMMLRAVRGSSVLDLPRAGEVQLDWHVLGFAAALSILTGILFGLGPAWSATGIDLVSLLKAGSERASGGAARRAGSGFSIRGILVIMQISLSIVLSIGAALLIESVIKLRGESLGFISSNLLTMRISLPPLRYDTDERRDRFFEALRDRAAALPGVRAAAAAMTIPMTTFAGSPVQDAREGPLPLNQRRIATILVVTPGYFQTLGIPLRRGRDFSSRDRPGAQRVAIIDEAFARRFWPGYPAGTDPIGQQLLIGGTDPRPVDIVGIAASIHQNLENTAWPESVYVSFDQNPLPSAFFAIRTDKGPQRFIKTIRREVTALDRDQPIADVHTMDDLLEMQLGQHRVLMLLLLSFAGMALFLALLGTYGVVAYSVAQRTREMGIRQALGASRLEIMKLVVGQALRLALAGAMLGVSGAWAATRLLQSFLFHIGATDPATITGVASLSISTAIVASYFPARRASQVDPMAAMKSE